MKPMKFKQCFQITSYTNFQSTALLLLRLIAGCAFAIHGWGKMQNPMSWMGPGAPVPGFFQLLASISEFCGGLGLILGFLTPLASIGIACTMTVAVLMVSLAMKAPFVSPNGGMSFELPLVFWGVAILFLAVGPGKFSLDSKVFGKKR